MTTAEDRIRAFERLLRDGRIDLNSGAWKFDTNVRVAVCGRCGGAITRGRGRPYNEFMTDFYRASTRYLCKLCARVVVAREKGER